MRACDVKQYPDPKSRLGLKQQFPAMENEIDAEFLWGKFGISKAGGRHLASWTIWNQNRPQGFRDLIKYLGFVWINEARCRKMEDLLSSRWICEIFWYLSCVFSGTLYAVSFIARCDRQLNEITDRASGSNVCILVNVCILRKPIEVHTDEPLNFEDISMTDLFRYVRLLPRPPVEKVTSIAWPCPDDQPLVQKGLNSKRRQKRLGSQKVYRVCWNVRTPFEQSSNFSLFVRCVIFFSDLFH
jgi:hypothetical protein